MARKGINPDNVFDPRKVFGPSSYQQAIRVGNLVFVSGQAPIDQEGRLAHVGDARGQAMLVMESLKRVLEASGATLDDVVKVTTYYTRLEDRGAIAEARAHYFGQDPPCHTGIVIKSLYHPDCLLEIDAIAVIGSQ